MYDFWNSPFYKPRTKIHDAFWHDFLSAAKMLILMNNKEEPDVYDVFNKIRQDNLSELPYSQSFIEQVDAQVEKEFARESKSRKNTGSISK